MNEIIAQSKAMREAVGLAERVAATDANVLVTGESGVGKDALAFHIHSRSARAPLAAAPETRRPTSRATSRVANAHPLKPAVAAR